MPGTIRKIKQLPSLPHRKRVAAYARVSSGKDAMLHSLSAQVSYYSALIQNNPEWEYAGVYVDEAVTGTKIARNDFRRMVDDCREGKVDMIITKSISRFARNTVVLLETVRELKSLNVDVFFEEQNLHSASADGELMLTILASYAQEESRSVSENCKWRIRKGFERGELMCLQFMLGYRIQKGKVEIDPSKAETVQEIFHRAIAGESFRSISQRLNARGVYGAFGGKWIAPHIRNILSNEKYTGNALLQKTYINNHIDKKSCSNDGELPRYYATNTHPAIIDDATFQAAQAILHKLDVQNAHRAKPLHSEFTSIIRCGHCGNTFRRVTSNGSAGWNCRTYQEQGKRFCHSKKIPEETLKATTAEVLGLEVYDAAAFLAQIDHILVPEHNQLTFVFKDGHTVHRTWLDRSRRDSWTPEMRAKARQRRKP